MNAGGDHLPALRGRARVALAQRAKAHGEVHVVRPLTLGDLRSHGKPIGIMADLYGFMGENGEFMGQDGGFHEVHGKILI